MTRLRSVAFAVLAALLGVGSPQAQSVVPEQAAPPYAVPMGEGLFRVTSAEPIGKGRLNIRFLNEAFRINVDKVGTGTSVTGNLGLGYGLANTLDLTASIPVMMDIAGGLTKYGTGDITTTMKVGFPGEFPSRAYGGFELMATHPYGYKDRKVLNVRPYSRGSRELAARGLFDFNHRQIGMRFNVGYLFSSQLREPGPMLGAAVEIGRGQIFTATAEYWREPAVTAGEITERATFGAHMNLWFLRLEAGVEKGLSSDLPSVTGMAGVRIQTSFGGLRKNRTDMSTVEIPRRYRGGPPVRVAVVNFAGFEAQKAGEMVARYLKQALTRYGHIRVVEVGEGAQYLDPDAAVRLAEMSDADVVITGRVVRYESNRSSRPNVPLVLGFPQTQAVLETDVRIVDRTEQGEVLSTRVGGSGTQNRGVRMFPTPGDDQTSYLSVIEKEQLWQDALQELVSGLLGRIGQRFNWLPGSA